MDHLTPDRIISAASIILLILTLIFRSSRWVGGTDSDHSSINKLKTDINGLAEWKRGRMADLARLEEDLRRIHEANKTTNQNTRDDILRYIYKVEEQCQKAQHR